MQINDLFETDMISHNSAQLGLYLLSGKTSYRKISWSLEAARFGFGLSKALPISERYDHYNT